MDSQPRLATLLLIATLPLIVAWYAAGDSAAPRETGAKAVAVEPQPRAPTAAPTRRPAPTRPAARRAPTPRPTQAARRDLLIHPLVGTRTAKLTRILGRPTTRSSEAGLSLLEYHLPEADFQLVIVERRVVEVNRIR